MRRMKLTVILGLLLAGTVLLTTGCAQPEDSTKIERPSNNNNNNQNTGNGNQGNENENQGNGNENIGNGQGGNQQGGNTETRSEPYDHALSNGYVLHSFMGETPDLSKKTIVDTTNYYLGKAETYIMGLVDGFSQSLSNRPDAKAYFQPYINALKNNDYYTVDKYDAPYSDIDPLININSRNGDYIFADIIKSLGATADSTDFYYAYRTLENESFKLGLGQERNYGNADMDKYNRERKNIADWNSGFDLDNDIDNNNCQQVVNKLHTMATKAANNMDNGVTADDLRRVVNLSLTANSMAAMHNNVKSNLDHTACALGITVEQTMSDTFDELLSRNAVKDQGLTR